MLDLYYHDVLRLLTSEISTKLSLFYSLSFRVRSSLALDPDIAQYKTIVSQKNNNLKMTSFMLNLKYFSIT